jgi:methionine aminotransferase
LAEYTRDESTYLSLPTFYKAKRDRLANGLATTRFKPYHCPGTFFLLADYSQISDRSESDFSIWLTKEHGVTVIPVSAFYSDPSSEAANNGIVRFCFAKTDETLDRAIEQLRSV